MLRLTTASHSVRIVSIYLIKCCLLLDGLRCSAAPTGYMTASDVPDSCSSLHARQFGTAGTLTVPAVDQDSKPASWKMYLLVLLFPLAGLAVFAVIGFPAVLCYQAYADWQHRRWVRRVTASSPVSQTQPALTHETEPDWRTEPSRIQSVVRLPASASATERDWRNRARQAFLPLQAWLSRSASRSSVSKTQPASVIGAERDVRLAVLPIDHGDARVFDDGEMDPPPRYEICDAQQVASLPGEQSSRPATPWPGTGDIADETVSLPRNDSYAWSSATSGQSFRQATPWPGAGSMVDQILSLPHNNAHTGAG